MRLLSTQNHHKKKRNAQMSSSSAAVQYFRKRRGTFAIMFPWLLTFGCVGITVLNQRRLQVYHASESTNVPPEGVADSPQQPQQSDAEGGGGATTAAAATPTAAEQASPKVDQMERRTQEVQITGSTSGSPYAYMFVIGGIHEDKPAYKGFIYNVLVATSQIRKLGSTCDVILYVQLSADSNRTQLPEEDTRQLLAMNIQIRTLPKPIHGETFASLVFEKFRALEMTEYKRVLFLDADAIPVANLDYIFHLSDPSHATTPTILRPNLILASRAEACNAGMFMLQPQVGAWDELNGIIDRVQNEGKTMPYPHFNFQKGWGYNFVAEKDYWRGTQKTGNRWRYHAGHSDQGLLYYWTKFYKRDVSVVIQDEIENWIDTGASAPLTIDGKPKPVLETTLRGEPLLNYTAVHPTAYQFSCDNQRGRDKKHQSLQCIVPYRDFAHFMGGSKPWQDVGCPLCILRRSGESTAKYNAPAKIWFAELQELDSKLNMNLDFENWSVKHHTKSSPLGTMAMYYDFLPEHKKDKPAEEEATTEAPAAVETREMVISNNNKIEVTPKVSNTTNNKSNNSFSVTAVIIEIRCNPALSMVLLAAEEFYGPEVKIVVYHSAENARFVQGLMEVHPTLQNSARVFRHQIVPEHYGDVSYKKYYIYYGNYWYSGMLSNLTFWDTINTPYSIIMQSDTLVCRQFHLQDFAPRNESYIGGISGFKREFNTKVTVTADPNPNEYIKYNHLNGGYSLRRVDWVQRCIQRYGRIRVWIEDALFRHCQEMEIQGTVYVNELQAYSFASDNGKTVCFNDPSSTNQQKQQRLCPMAVHKPWKDGASIWGKDSYQELVDYCPALTHHERLTKLPMESGQVCPAYDRKGNSIKTFNCGCTSSSSEQSTEVTVSGTSPSSPIKSTSPGGRVTRIELSANQVAKEYEGPLKCATWDDNLDSWWEVHPDWQPFDNSTHTCFRPIQNQEHAQFLQEVYLTQYHGKDCSEMMVKNNARIGYGTAIHLFTVGFWNAFRQRVPFEISKQKASFHWMYVPPYPTGTPGFNNSWASCPGLDHSCYFIPISTCKPEPGREESPIKVRRTKEDELTFPWLEQFLTRPRQHIRRKKLALMEKEAPILPKDANGNYNCTWIHVRRGDIEWDKGNPRNFHELGEYIEKGQISVGQTVLLLTDDEAVIEEAQYLHPQYNWLYWNRTRNRGATNYNRHIPSNDPAKEFLILLSEIELAGRCSKGVHGRSNIVTLFRNSMIRQNNGIQNVELIQVDRPGEEEKVKPEDFMTKLEAKLNEAKSS